ncbi:MAG: pectate lyase [Eubacteriales bacterium]|nr:pectate lyase [Eubacteriales bacterium]
MKGKTKKHLSVLLAVVMITAMLAANFSRVEGASSEIVISESGGYEEGAYVEWSPVYGADGYKAYVSCDGTTYVPVDDTLIREYNDCWRADAVGLKPGSYVIKVEAVKTDESNAAKVLSTAVTGQLSVIGYDRSGFAFSSNSPLKSASGAYNDDGTLKTGAQVVYVTPETAKTCTAVVGGVTVTGFQAILDAKQKKNTSNDIIDFRIVGCVRDTDLDKMSSSSEGLQIKGSTAYTNMNITIEGIGEDASIWGFGMLVRNCGNVEIRNIGILAFMDDGISLDTGNCNVWVHDLDLFYGKAGGDSDQAKGDGSVDIKGKSTYITVSYVHFWDSGKCSLCGMSDTEEFMVTYHHNWFDHSDSRHPRIRVASVHLYNNYFDGNAKYGVGTTKGSSAFVEANYFRNCKYPMMSSLQGTDKDVVAALNGSGTFSGEAGGMIKAYNNKIEGASSLVYANAPNGLAGENAVSFDAYLASDRSENVPSSYKTLSGGTVYNNFDTSADYDLGVDEASIDKPEEVYLVVTSKAGRLGGGDFKWSFSDSADSSYALDTQLKEAVMSYQSSVKSIGGLKGTGSSGGSTQPPTEGPTVEPTTKPETQTPTGGSSGGQEITKGSYVHNFTSEGKTSAYFSITGNLSDSKGTVNYNGMVLEQCLKMESSTKITFNNKSDAKLILVFNSANSKNIKVDGTKYTFTENVLEMQIAAGSHEITKADTANLFYIKVESNDAGEEDKPTQTESVSPEESGNPELNSTAADSGADAQEEASMKSETTAGVQTNDKNIAVLWVIIALASAVSACCFVRKTKVHQ